MESDPPPEPGRFRSSVEFPTALWVGNGLTGTLGRSSAVPSSVAAIADTTSATLANLEIEVNKIKARMRLFYTIT